MRHRRLPALALTFALGACASSPDEPQISVYHALSRPEIRAHMRDLADELGALVELTRPTAPADATRRANVLAALGRIDARARRVGGGDTVTNYSAVNDYMDGFLGDVALARDFAAREPANLVPANRLVQSCLACHQSL